MVQKKHNIYNDIIESCLQHDLSLLRDHSHDLLAEETNQGRAKSTNQPRHSPKISI